MIRRTLTTLALLAAFAAAGTGTAHAATTLHKTGAAGFARGTCTVTRPGTLMLVRCATGQSEYLHWNFKLPAGTRRATCNIDAFACKAVHVYGRLWQARATVNFDTGIDVVFMIGRSA